MQRDAVGALRRSTPGYGSLSAFDKRISCVFFGEVERRLVQLAAIFSNWIGLWNVNAECRLMGL
jgi:hypothetical protein